MLGALAEKPVHGFAVAQLLAVDGPLGRIWTIPRPVVYQALKKLVALGLVEEGTTETTRKGPRRTLMAVTPAGARSLDTWLVHPVPHVRDLRSELLLKLALLDRAGRDPGPLVAAQRQALAERLEGLDAALAAAEGFDRVLARWRAVSTRAALEFLSELG